MNFSSGRKIRGKKKLKSLIDICDSVLVLKYSESLLELSIPVSIHEFANAKLYYDKGIENTFATQLLLSGANLKTVADCLGHSSTRHTIKYLNYVDELKTEAISSLPSIKL